MSETEHDICEECGCDGYHHPMTLIELLDKHSFGIFLLIALLIVAVL